MQLIFAIDFESFYAADYSVKTMGYRAYCCAPQFDPYLVSILGMDVDYVGPPATAPWDKLSGHHWISHNAAFDAEVFHRSQELGLIPATIAPAEWHCSADMSRYFGGPRSLDKAAAEMLGIKIDKSTRDFMRGKRFADLSTRDQDRVRQYAGTDSEVCLKLWAEYGPHWPDHEQELSRLTREIGRHGIGFDREKAARFKAILLNRIAEIEKPYAEGGPLPWRPVGKVGSIIEFKKACSAAGLPVPISTAEKNEQFALWLDEYSDRAPWVRAVRDWRKSNRLLKIIEAMEQRVFAGRLSYSLLYFGATTGRWSGANGLNLQNLNKENFLGVDLRSLLIAAPGHTFIIADLSQIEPRVLHWLAGDTAMLEMLREGFPLYEAHARATMGWTRGKLKDEDKKLYALAKARVLGLGYGSGAEKFRMIAKSLAGLDLAAEECFQVVTDYRSSNPQIIALWRRLEQQMRATPTGETFALRLTSPSCPDYQPRLLRYFNTHQVTVENNRTTVIAATALGGTEESWWGSKLVENLVQALARDIFASRMLALRQRGYRIVLHVHDEVVVECPMNQAEVSMNEVLSVLRQPPPWAVDLPLDAEAIQSTFYTK